VKLSKAEIKLQNQCSEYLTKDKLTDDEKLFVLEHFQEGATNINSVAGAFFTPQGLASDAMIECQGIGGKFIDLCAGIGRLTHAAKDYNDVREFTCVELNYDYAKIGMKVIPDANWIVGSIFDLPDERIYDVAICNPPFGNIKTGRDNDGFGGFEFSAIWKASKIAKFGIFILPQMSTPFLYSGRLWYEERMNDKVKRFTDKTGIKFSFNCGIDTSIYKCQWHGVAPICEVCTFDFTEPRTGELF
jgi:hypothetical protein